MEVSPPTKKNWAGFSSCFTKANTIINMSENMNNALIINMFILIQPSTNKEQNKNIFHRVPYLENT